MIDQVLADVEAVLIAGRVRVLRRETVADGDDGEVGVVGVVSELEVLVGFGLKDPAAAVDVVEDAFGFAFGMNVLSVGYEGVSPWQEEFCTGLWLEDANGNVAA